MCQRSNEIPCLYRCYTMSVDAIFTQRYSGTVHSWIRPEYWCKTKIKYYFGILTTEPTLLVQGTHTNNKKEQHIKTRWVEWDTSECGDCITEMFKEEAKCLNCSLWVVRATGGCQILLFRGGKARWEWREGRRLEMVSEVLGVGVCLLSPISMTTSPPTHPSPLLIGRTWGMSDVK